jgi:hypothetical protein
MTQTHRHCFSGDQKLIKLSQFVRGGKGRIMTASALEQQFEEACLADVDECRQLGYNPGYFLRMVGEHGAREATRRLMLSDHLPEGFTRLVMMGRTDLTLEAFVHDNPQFHALFDDDVVQAATERLHSVGYI